MKRLIPTLILAILFLQTTPLNAFLWHDFCAREYHNQCGIYLGIDTLYWNASQNCLTRSPTITKEDKKTTINFNKLAYDWEFGYRLFAGYHPGRAAFNIGLFFTHYDTNASHSRDIIENAQNIEIERRWEIKKNLNYNVLDLLLSRDHLIRPATIVRPFFGFRSLWVDQDYINKKINITSNGEEIDEVQKVHANLDVWAIGAHGGIEYLMDLYRGFSINLTLTGSLLEGNLDNVTKQYSDESNTLTPTSIYVIKEDRCLPIPGYQMAAGITWETTFFDCGWSRFDLNYELSQWFNISDIEPRFFQKKAVAHTNKNALLLRGLTVRSLYFF